MVPLTSLLFRWALCVASFLISLGKGSKKKSMEISIRGGQTRSAFFLYPQFIQKCIKFFFWGGGNKYSCQKYFWKIFLAKIFLVGIFSAKNIFSENIFDVNIFDNNIFGKNIFFLPFLHLTSLQTTPTSSQLLISDFWNWVWHNKRRTNLRTGRTQWLFLLLY